MTTIAVLCAMGSEIDELALRLHTHAVGAPSGLRIQIAEKNGVRVLLCVCGEGKTNAALGTEAVILRYAPDALLFTGVAGGIAEDLKAGNLVVADSFVQHDYDISALGYKPGYIVNLDTVVLTPDAELSAALLRAAQVCSGDAHSARTGRFATGDCFVGDAGSASRIREMFGADCVDMESAAFAQVCWLNGCRFAALRAVSDNGDGTAFRNFREFLTFAVGRTVDTVEAFLREIAPALFGISSEELR